MADSTNHASINSKMLFMFTCHFCPVCFLLLSPALLQFLLGKMMLTMVFESWHDVFIFQILYFTWSDRIYLSDVLSQQV